MKNENRNKERKKNMNRKKKFRTTDKITRQSTNQCAIVINDESVLRLTAKPNRQLSFKCETTKQNENGNKNERSNVEKWSKKNCSKIKQTNRRLFITMCITRNTILTNARQINKSKIDSKFIKKIPFWNKDTAKVENWRLNEDRRFINSTLCILWTHIVCWVSYWWLIFYFLLDFLISPIFFPSFFFLLFQLHY